MTAVIPSLDHFRFEDYEYFYEPSDDTFLLCDALLMEVEALVALRPTMCVEFGYDMI